MTKYFTLVGCIMGLAATSLGTPPAHADNVSFVAEARALGFEQWDDVLVRMGLSACRFLQPQLRRHPDEVPEHVMRYASVDSEQAQRFVLLSVKEYCPQYADRVAPR